MFRDYLWQLLTRPYKLKENSETGRWVGVLGDTLDDVKQTIFRLRRAWVVGTAAGNALDLHGEARHLRRYTGETDDELRRRVESAFEIYMLGGAVPGLLRGLEAIGFPGSKILENQAGLSWAEFVVVLGLDGDGKINSPAVYEKIWETIFLTKAAHTMPAMLQIEREQILPCYLGFAALVGGDTTVCPAQPDAALAQALDVGLIPMVIDDTKVLPRQLTDIDTAVQFGLAHIASGSKIIYLDKNEVIPEIEERDGFFNVTMGFAIQRGGTTTVEPCLPDHFETGFILGLIPVSGGKIVVGPVLPDDVDLTNSIGLALTRTDVKIIYAEECEYGGI